MGIRRDSPLCTPLVAVTIVSMLRLASAAQYAVGDGEGWTMNVNYTEWAAKHTFQEGDEIVFLYSRGTHDVLRVSSKDYDSCSVSNPIETDASGQTVYVLRAGDYYFICGFPAHCKQSQKVFLRVQPLPGTASTLIDPITRAEGPASGVAYGPADAFSPGYNAAPRSLASNALQFLLLAFGGLGLVLV